MKKEYLTSSPSQTKKLGKIVAEKVLKIKRKRRAQVLGLEGNLGGGKTTFLQGFAKGLGIKKMITSPTFVIMRRFAIPKSKYPISNIQYLIHIDCYRIKKSKEILDLGFKEIISNPKNIIAIEWANRVRKIIPQNTTWIIFEFTNKNERKITIKW